ncbi:MAG TPA: tetratricopeptide repeat protein, partial [Thermomicrobiaceae bacterium]|nr:tetratricopeptide repeat protein [Thermomicrobiaceae bacterium]
LHGGALMVELGPVRDPDHVLPRIASGLGLRAAGAADPLPPLVAALAERELLLVLDNFEHLLPAAERVAALLARCPRLRVLVTSRAPLRLRGEQEFPVRPLPVPEVDHSYSSDELVVIPSVALLKARLHAVCPDQTFDDETMNILAEICRRLDGLPLAIELAAIRGRLFNPPALLAQLTHRLPLLTASPRDLPPRQQTLRRTFAWSEALLSPAQQALFSRLSVFVGGCTLAAADAICNAEGSANLLDDLAELAEQSLLQPGGRSGADPRFVMLETIREYAAERLAERGEVASLQATHAAYFLALAEEAEPWLDGPEQGIWLDRLDADYSNLRAALRTLLDRPDPTPALRLSQVLARFWIKRGHPQEGVTWLREALDRASKAPSPLRAKALATTSYLLWLMSEFEQAESSARQAISLFRDLGDDGQRGYCLRVLGNIAFARARYSEAQACFDRSLAISRLLGSETNAAITLGNLGLVAGARGDHQKAATLFEESIAWLRRLGDISALGYFLGCLTHEYCDLGELALAASMAQQGLSCARQAGFAQAICCAHLALAEVAFARCEGERAVAHFELALDEARRWGSKLWILVALGRLSEARGVVGDFDRARLAVNEALVLSQADAPPAFVLRAVEVAAWLAAEAGRLEQAACLWGGVSRLREEMQIPRTPTEEARQARYRFAARKQLGDEDWVLHWTLDQGKPLPALIDQALAATSTCRESQGHALKSGAIG